MIVWRRVRACVQQMQAQHLPAALAAAAAHVPGLGAHPVGGLPPAAAAAAAAGSAAGLMSLARLPGVSSAHLHGAGAPGSGGSGAGGPSGAGSVKEEKGEICLLVVAVPSSLDAAVARGVHAAHCDSWFLCAVQILLLIYLLTYTSLPPEYLPRARKLPSRTSVSQSIS